MNANSAQSQQQRAIRVFISSTFRDMKEEREELVKQVFPQLRKMCEKRGVVWGEVDLRWGITDEQKAEGRVLPICLKEIHECRPYFIGMLGEKYGWIPAEIPEELTQREPWLVEHRGKSVTELEILHGVLNNPEMSDHAYFYFRDPAYIYTIPAEKRGDFVEGPIAEEIENLGHTEAKLRAQQRREKLIDLKERIRKSRLPIRDNYVDPKELGDLVFKDLSKLVDKLFPEGEEPHPLDREAAEHDAFAQSRFSIYIGRDDYYQYLNDHVAGDGPPLVVLGESGSGKSALLANWSMKYRADNPDDLVIIHFIGATPYSADWSMMVRRIMGELKRRFDIQDDIPTDPDKIRQVFANWLHMANAQTGHGRVVIILDALNQLEDRDNAPDLVWLPPFIPQKIRLILSTLPGRPLDDLKKRNWPAMTVEPLKDNERTKLIPAYLGQYRKSLSDVQVKRISASEQTRNPLFLRALLDELRLFGVHQHLDRAIEHYLSSKDIPELYEKILKRLEQDYDREWPGLVQDAMTCIWASRRGLSEAELLDLLGVGDEPMPYGHWAQFSSAVERLLVSRSGLLCFVHNYIREAIHRRFLQSEEDERSAHLRVADYFAKLDLGPRKIDELMWQLSESRSWQRLYDLLADIDFFAAVWQQNRFDAKAYWVKVQDGSDLRMVDAYKAVLDAPMEVPDAQALINLSSLFLDTGHLSELLILSQYLTNLYLESGDRQKLAVCLGYQGESHRTRGEFDEAMRLYKEQERMCRELGDKAGLSNSLCSQGNIHQARGKLDEAMRLYKEDEQLRHELGHKAGLSSSLGNQGIIHYSRGELDEAMRLYKEQERICREIGDKAGLSHSLGNQGMIHRTRGQFDEAMRLYKEDERICRELGHKARLSGNLGNQGILHYFRGELEEAMLLYKEMEILCRELDYKLYLASSLVNQGIIHQTRGEIDEAMGMYEEVEHICREIGDKRGLSSSLCNQGNIHFERGELDEALRLHKEVEAICREIGDKEELSRSLANQGNIYEDRGQLDEAMRVYKECQHICREVGNKRELSGSLAFEGSILAKKGKKTEGLLLAEEAYRMALEHGHDQVAETVVKPIVDSIRSQFQ